MQVVGHLVGVDADQRALDLVDGAVERVERHIARVARGKPLAAAGRSTPRSRGCARRRSPTGATGSRGRRPTCRSASGVPSKAGSMPCSYMAWPASCMVLKSAVAEQVLVHARGDAHVAERELGRERVVGLVLPAALEVVADAPGHIQPEVHCCASGYVRRRQESSAGGCAVIASTIGTSCVRSSANSGRTDACLHAVIGDVDQRIGDVFVAGEEIGERRLRSSVFSRCGCTAAKSFLRPRRGPDLIAGRDVRSSPRRRPTGHASPARTRGASPESGRRRRSHRAGSPRRVAARPAGDRRPGR